jgi:uncharacterized protein with NRDE domain
MCLIAWHWQPDHETPLLLLGNRDEFYARPTQALQWWEDAPVLAGRDQQAGGTWLGVNRRGQLAALTNYRDPSTMRDDTPSRGALVANFLSGDWSSKSYLAELASKCMDYNPFNLLVFDGQQLMGLESRLGRVVSIAPGTSAVSNADFHTPWPKVRGLLRGLAPAVAGQSVQDPELLALLHNAQPASDRELPKTGVSLETERALSPAFIATPTYGTRACSIVRMGRSEVRFLEESFNAQGPTGTVVQVFAPCVQGVPNRARSQ